MCQSFFLFKWSLISYDFSLSVPLQLYDIFKGTTKMPNSWLAYEFWAFGCHINVCATVIQSHANATITRLTHCAPKSFYSPPYSMCIQKQTFQLSQLPLCRINIDFYDHYDLYLDATNWERLMFIWILENSYKLWPTIQFIQYVYIWHTNMHTHALTPISVFFSSSVPFSLYTVNRLKQWTIKR